MPRRVALAAVPLALLACETPRTLSTTNVARAAFPPGRTAAVFENAVRSISAAGYELVACDAERGVLETSILEFDAPCGRTTCLARQAVRVKLGHRAARITVRRELYDGAWRSWQPEAAAGAVEAAQTLALEIVGGASPGRVRPHRDPCADWGRLDVAATASSAR